MQLLIDIAVAGWRIWNETAVYVLLGFVLAALLHVWRIGERLIKYVRYDNARSVFLAALAGVPLPLCSCGVLPTATALRRLGAGRGAVVAFLIATPETGVTSILLSYALLGPIVAVFRPIAAFLTAIIAGLLVNAFDRPSDTAPRQGLGVAMPIAEAGPAPAREPWARRVYRFAFVELLDDLAGWLVFGVFLSGVIQAIAPATFFSLLFGHPLVAMLVMLAVSVPLYVCAESSTPIAAALVARGMNPGAAMVLLLAGPATNAGAIGLLSQQLGRRAVTIYVASICVVSIVMGFALNGALDLSHENLASRVAIATSDGYGRFQLVASLVLAGLCLVSFHRRRTGEKLMGRLSKAVRVALPKTAIRWAAVALTTIWIATTGIAVLAPRDSVIQQRINGAASPCPCHDISGLLDSIDAARK